MIFLAFKHAVLAAFLLDALSATVVSLYVWPCWDQMRARR